MNTSPATRNFSFMRHEQTQQFYIHFAPECMFIVLVFIFIASLTGALTVLILWRCLFCSGGDGRWYGQDQTSNRPTAEVQSSAPKTISHAEEKTAAPSVDVDIDVMVRVFEAFTCSELQDLLRLRSLSIAGKKHDLKKRLATFCVAKESLKLKRR
jgi:hypothetical protein